MRPRLTTVAFLALSLAVGALALRVDAARESPPTHASTATTETLGALALTDGWCVATNGTASVDLDAAAPGRITDAIKHAVRFVEIKFMAGATSTRGCHRIGGALPATSCNALDGDTVGVLGDGQAAVYAVARDFTAGGLPQMDGQADAGSDGRFCITIGW